jgi:hypothetical protein
VGAVLVCAMICHRVAAEDASPSERPAVPIAESASPQATAEQIERWILELADDEYPVRLTAAEELLNAGMVAREPLVILVDSPDPERRAAARRLIALIDRAEFKRRLAEFAADTDGDLGLTLPGWEQFREHVGDDSGSRGLFVEMQRHEAALLSSGFEAPVHSLDDPWEARLNRLVQWQSRVTPGSDPPALGSCAAMVFVGATAEMEVSDRSVYLVENLVQQPPIREHLQAGEHRDAIRRLVAAWIRNCPNRNEELLKRRLSLASIHQLNEVVPWALSIATGKGDSARLQPATRATAILLVGQLGQQEHVDKLEPLLSDTAICTVVGPGQPQANVQICDVALVTMLHLSGQRPADYGYMDARLQPQQVPQFQIFSVEDGEQRAAAIAKWRAWRAERRRDTQVIPAEFREENSTN